MIAFRDIDMGFVRSPFHLLLKRKKVECRMGEEGVVRFIKDLSILVNAAVPLVKSLEVLAKQQRDKMFSTVVGNLAKSVHSGLPLSTSLMMYPRIFDVLLVSMVSAGEASCSLGEVLERIARHRERGLKLKKKVRSIMIYPSIVIGFAMLIISLLFLFIIPKFESVFATALNGTSLPLVTRMIIGASHSFQEIFIFLGIVMVMSFFGIKLMRKEFKDGIILRIPICGDVIRDVNIALFSRILGTLLTNGVQLIEALKVSAGVTNNWAIKESLKKVRNEVEDGEALFNAIQAEGIFPELVVGMIQVGEETGTLSKMLLEVANKLEDDIEQAVGRLTAMLEPLMTVLLAVIIGSIVIALFLPIVNVMNNVVSF